MNWETRKIIGNQLITSIDSIGANIVEGYGRFHYLDKTKFYYNARGSLFEAKHWIFLLYKRNFIIKGKFDEFLLKIENINRGLNELIKTTKNNQSH